MSLENKVAIVTGGNSGIGQSIVLELARQGAKVVIDYVVDPEAAVALEQQVAKLGDQSIGVEADVSKIADLQKLVEKAVEKRLNSYLTFKIEGQATNASTRVSVSRFRFHLDRGDRAQVSKALEQTLKFDMRLAQAMYNRDLGERSPAVVAEFDAVRAATTSTRSFGFELLGMNIYHRAVVKKEGTFIVQTPEGARSILFDSIHKDGGWFQMDHGYTRTGVAAQTLDARNPEAFKSEANLFLQTAVGDKHMDDDIIIDSVDALLAGIAGPAAVEALSAGAIDVAYIGPNPSINTFIQSGGQSV